MIPGPRWCGAFLVHNGRASNLPEERNHGFAFVWDDILTTRRDRLIYWNQPKQYWPSSNVGFFWANIFTTYRGWKIHVKWYKAKFNIYWFSNLSHSVHWIWSPEDLQVDLNPSMGALGYVLVWKQIKNCYRKVFHCGYNTAKL